MKLKDVMGEVKPDHRSKFLRLVQKETAARISEEENRGVSQNTIGRRLERGNHMRTREVYNEVLREKETEWQAMETLKDETNEILNRIGLTVMYSGDVAKLKKRKEDEQ